MPTAPRVSLWRYMLLVGLVGCDGASFSEQPYCHADCPLPPTQPPVVTWIAPAAGSVVYPTTILTVGARDDKQVDHVDFYYFDHHLTPGSIQAPPYSIEFARYLDTGFIAPGNFILMAVATDIEGNADTAYLPVKSYKP